MSGRDYDRGLCDGEKNNYEPPHDKGLLREVFEKYTDREVENRNDYEDGYTDGRK